MHACRAHRRLASWFAALTFLLVSLAPAWGHGLAAATSGSWIEICTTQGSLWIQPGDDGAERAPASAHVLEHCPACSLHAPTLGLPPAAHLAHLPLRLSHELPHACLAAPRTLHAWVRAQPRAPPLFA